MSDQITRTMMIVSITVLACILIDPLGLPNVSEALDKPCYVFKRNIFLGLLIILVSGALSFIFLRLRKTSLSWSLSVASVQAIFLSLFAFGVLFMDDCISCFAFLTRSCEL